MLTVSGIIVINVPFYTDKSERKCEQMSKNVTALVRVDVTACSQAEVTHFANT